MNPEKLTHLIYTSAAIPNLDHSELKTILLVARGNNAQLSVTGMLLYISRSFFQVLEGDEATLAELFARISLDPRHGNVTRIIHEPIAQRAFGDWTMGFLEGEASELETIDGLNDFFGQGNSLNNLEPGRAKKLLSAFALGRWRAQLKGSVN
ncbi:MAG: BLUF domain-containing protein [Chloroflexota bacterium]|nr:BLUF domain-containing protein [Chloroflexota bacterium]